MNEFFHISFHFQKSILLQNIYNFKLYSLQVKIMPQISIIMN
jgi:hypothetical protein